MTLPAVQSQASLAFRRIFVTAPCLPKFLVVIAYSHEKPWHQLSQPMFTRSDARELCRHVAGLSFDEGRNAFIHVDDGRITCFEAVPHVMGGKLVDFYAIGPNWGWKLAEEDRVPAAHGELLHVNVRPAALEWFQSLADDACVPLDAFCSFLLAGYIEQRMELRHALDLSRFDAVLCIASKAHAGHNYVRIAVQAEAWIGVVNALVHLASDDAFKALSWQSRRERLVEAMLDQLAREVAGI